MGNFTKVPNELFQLYTKIPGFTGDHVLMYVILTSYHNEKYGYAYPDQLELKLRLNCGINKVGQLAKKLEEVGLIEYRRKYSGGNYVYYVKQPIKDPTVFYDTFPEAKAYYSEKYDNVMKRKESTSRNRGDFEDIIDWL